MDARELLRQHYSEKYAHAGQETVTALPLTTRPRNRHEMAAKLVMQGAGGNYLEIGAGSGQVALTALHHYDRMVLTELSDTRTAAMQRLFQHAAHVTVLRHDIQTGLTQFSDQTFDTVVMVAVIEHLVEPISVLREIRRVLKPTGRLIVDTPNIAKWTRRVKLLAGRFPGTSSVDEGLPRQDERTATAVHDGGHLHYFTFRSLERLGLEWGSFWRVERHGYGSFLARAWPTLFSEVMVLFHC